MTWFLYSLKYTTQCSNKIVTTKVIKIWATSLQNKQNDFCTQRRLRSTWAYAQSNQSLHCLHEETLGPQLPIMGTAKTLIRLGGCPGWSESSVSAQSFCWFCHEAPQITMFDIWNAFRKSSTQSWMVNKYTEQSTRTEDSLKILCSSNYFQNVQTWLQRKKLQSNWTKIPNWLSSRNSLLPFVKLNLVQVWINLTTVLMLKLFNTVF